MPVLFQFLLRISRSFVILAPWPMSRDCWGPFHSCTSKPPTDQIGRSSDICDSLLSKQLCCKLKAGIRVTALLTELCSALINAHCALCGSHPHRCDVPSAAQILQSLQSWCTLAGVRLSSFAPRDCGPPLSQDLSMPCQAIHCPRLDTCTRINRCGCTCAPCFLSRFSVTVN